MAAIRGERIGIGMIVNGPIGSPEREIVVTPESEPVPQRIVVPDSPADLPEREPERVL